MATHRHHKWLKDIADQMQRDFGDAHAAAAESSGVQRSGHHGEEIWGRFLRAWLPPQYEIGYRKYILLEHEAEDGSDISGETDIVIFHPAYPAALRDRHEVLLSGVVAAFSSKLTLDRSGLAEAVREAAKVRRAATLRARNLHSRLLTPFLYGVLAHTHSWKSAASKPIATTTSALAELDAEHSMEPREALDLLCVADLNCWSKMVQIVSPQVAAILPPSVSPPGGHIQYSFLNVGHDESIKDASGLALPPVAVLIGLLYQKLSYYDDSLSALADGFRVTDTSVYSLSSTSARNRLFSPDLFLGPEDRAAFERGLVLYKMYW
ncbi:DUF6602 domain-containing protein [Nocardia sp. NPDC050710]|uniref:DUF6602 domain-containing protein n=1 Tax=Nocardia sp. NPDC050710 TaxID=3157220 RepID=UPI0033E3B97E